MADVVVTEFMDLAALKTLEADYTVHRDETLWEKPEALRESIAHAQALIVRNKTPVDVALLDAAPDLKVVGRLGVGLDNIDLKACAERNVRVCPATGANADAVAEYAVAAAMVLLRGLIPATQAIAQGAWSRTDHSAGRESAGRVFGLLGYGSIGRVTAERAGALGFRVIAHDPAIDETDNATATTETQIVSFATLLDQADVLSVHVPLTSDTRGLLDAPALAAMKPGAILINTARGGIVDEAALADALTRGHLGGAALDVFEEEPTPAKTCIALSRLHNVLLTPHIAGLSEDANTRVSELTVANVRAVLRQS
ncbi:MAG: NAD(P)-dependent oxidoreductase [Pseudomonadota bacterium]